MEKLILTSENLFDIECLIDSVAHYLSGNECPEWDAKRVDFHCGDGQSNGWFVSKIESDTLLRVNEVYMRRHGLYTPRGYRYVSEAWCEAMFCVDGTNYYFMSK